VALVRLVVASLMVYLQRFVELACCAPGCGSSGAGVSYFYPLFPAGD
jgi:hypothetical protein